MLFDCYLTTPWKLLIFIIRFSRGEIDQVNDGSFMLSSVVEFIQILPFRFHPLWNFLLISIEISQEIKLISLTYVIINCSSEKKDCQTFKNYSFRTQLGKKTGPASSATPNIKFNLFSGIYKRDCKLSKTFFFQNINFDWVMSDFLPCVKFCYQNEPFLFWNRSFYALPLVCSVDFNVLKASEHNFFILKFHCFMLLLNFDISKYSLLRRII